MMVRQCIQYMYHEISRWKICPPYSDYYAVSSISKNLIAGTVLFKSRSVEPLKSILLFSWPRTSSSRLLPSSPRLTLPLRTSADSPTALSTHPLDLLVGLLERPQLGDELLPEVQEPAACLALQDGHENGQGLLHDVAAEETQVDCGTARSAEDEGHGHGEELGLALELELLRGGALELAAHEAAEQLQGVLVLRLNTFF